MKIDEKRLAELTEATADIHAGGMRIVREELDRVVEEHHGAARPGRRAVLGRGLITAGALGAGFGVLALGRATATALAAATPDEQALGTAAALEAAAIAVYTQAAGLPPAVSGASNPVVQAFVANTLKQHQDHLTAFNGALTAMGGSAVTAPDAAFQSAVIAPLAAKLAGPADVIALALKIEDTLAQSFISYGSGASAASTMSLFAAIAPVEAQHAAVLLAVQGLLLLGAPQLIQLPAPIAELPAAAGDLAFPNAFYKTAGARPASEG